MSRRVMIGVFEREEDTVAAVRASRSQGLKVVDVYGPYPIHGLDRILGLEPSKLPWVCFLLGLLGASFKVWFEYWTTSSSWPINVGGKPWNSLPAFVPVTFEVMVLFAGVSTVIAFFLTRRLFPGRHSVLPVPGVTDDRFAVILEETDATFDSERVRALLEGFRAVQVEEHAEQEGR
jgi:ActD protein